MLIIPISEEEKVVIERGLERNAASSYVASVLWFSAPPLASPKRRDSLATREANFQEQQLLDKLEDVMNHGEQQHEKYEKLQEKIYKFGSK